MPHPLLPNYPLSTINHPTPYAKGVVPYSPGLRGPPRYPGSRPDPSTTPKGLCRRRNTLCSAKHSLIPPPGVG